MLGSLDIVVYVLIISAGLLAFVVLYNLNNININERQRELATLRVLGFYNGEVGAYVYRESIMLTVIGIVVGAFLGIALHHYVVITAEIDLLMFGRTIRAKSYVLSGALTALFSALVNWVMYFRLKKIDMVEALKSIE
jgi:putative ABC transport system permease protein